MPIYEYEAPDGKVYEIDARDEKHLQRILGTSLQQTNPTEYDPASPEYQAKYGPLAGGSNFQNFRAGYGKGAMDLGRGIGQLFGVGPSREEYDEIKTRDAPLMNTKAGIAGNITGAVATSAPTMFIPGVNTYAGAGIAGAALGAAQPVGTQDSRLLNTGLGAVSGVTGKYVGGRIGDWAAKSNRAPMSAEARSAADAAAEARAAVSAGQAGAQNTVSGELTANLKGGGSGFGSVGDDSSAALTRAQQELLGRGKELGMRFTPGQATGSRALQQMEAKLESQPMTSGPFFALKDVNQKALNREVAASFGEASDTVDNVVLDRAMTRIGNVFESAKDDVARPIDSRQFLSFYAGMQNEVRGITKGFESHDLVQDLVKLANTGAATGKQLQPLTSKLGKAAYKEMTSPQGDRELGMALYQVKDYVDDILQSGMTQQQAKKFSQARGQYRNLINVLSRTNIVNPSSGNVQGRALAQMLQQRDRAGFTLGRNKTGMYDAARIAQAFPPIVGDSGTATRSMVTNPLEMMMRMPFNVASRAYLSSPSVNLATGASAAGRAASNAAGPAARNMFGTLPYYAPFALPGASAAALPPLLGQ